MHDIKAWDRATQRKWFVLTISATALILLTIAIWTVLTKNHTWTKWAGFSEGMIVSTTEERDPHGNLVKTVTTTTPQAGKNLWDVLSILVVPFSLVILGYLFQQSQQRQADEQLKEAALSSAKLNYHYGLS